MKTPYQRPVIKKLHASHLNKFGSAASGSRQVRTAIDGVPISELTAEFGSPLFVFSERAIRRKFRQFHSAFSTRYPDVAFGWSYKTNYLKAVCALMHQQGALAEIVSKMEYEKARALGVPADRIIFNGPHKPADVLADALAGGAMINVDHLEEIEELEHIAEGLGQQAPVGMRINLDAGIYPQWSRFGLNLESGQALAAIRRMSHGGRLRLNGLHCHLGTYILDPAAYQRQVEKLLDLAYTIEDRFGWRIQYLDLGGGFPSQSRLKGAYLPPEVSTPAIDEYAETICNALHAHLRPGHRPQLILESGRAMIDEAGSLIASVVAAKRLADGCRAYVLDAGVNLLYTAFWYRYNVETDRDIHGMREPSVLYGPLCMNIDCLDEAVQLPPLERGQRLIFSPVGAYSVTQWQQFIEYRPNVVLVGEDGQVEVIREAEDLSDIERRERLPPRLEMPSRPAIRQAV